ncbi:SDR family NAD(P)-dependent oxidoreductase [Salmonella enterica]|nr:SDR family NAD(P)-dependent oxidoreductase [Salmonella enterica]
MNQVAVVIGGGQTLGAFLCRGLAEEGYRVAVVDIQSDKAANVADAPRDKCAHFREINGTAAAFQYLQKNYNPIASSFL